MKFIKLFSAALAVAASLSASGAQAVGWGIAESEHFIIYSDASVKDTRAYASKLENFYLVTGAFYDQMSDSVLPAYQKTRLNYFNDISEFRVVRPDLDGHAFTPSLYCTEGTQYFSTADAQSNNNLYGQGLLDPDIDLNLAYMFFAYNDHVLHERFAKLPSWVRSGLNWYFMTAVFKDGEIFIGKPPPNIAMSFTAFGTDDLTYRKNFTPYADRIAGKAVPPGKADMVALQNWVMVSYLMSDPTRREKLVAYLRLVESGMDSLEAYDKTIAIEPESYGDILKTYAKTGVAYQKYKVSSLSYAAVTISDLPNYNYNVPLIDAALQTCPKKDDGLRLLSTMHKVAPQFPDDSLSQMALARAEVRFGDPEAALPYLTQRLAANPKDIDAQFLLGRLYIALAEHGPEEKRTQNYASARRELGKAYQLNPSSAPTLYFYARAFADKPDYPNENTMNALLLAQDYSGGSYDMYEAELDLRKGDYGAAQTIVDKALTFVTKETNKDCVKILNDLHDSLAARKPKADILPLFARYTSTDE